MIKQSIRFVFYCLLIAALFVLFVDEDYLRTTRFYRFFSKSQVTKDIQVKEDVIDDEDVDEDEEIDPAPSNVFQVIGVIDGDTIVAGSDGMEVKIKLAAIDAPEKTQLYGEEATKYLSDRLANKTITIEDYGVDLYNQTVATVYVDGVDVNEAMVSGGFAWFDDLYANGKDYKQQQTSAREKREGMWVYPKGNIPPSVYRKLKTLGAFGDSIYRHGFYLSRSNVLHNRLCPQYMIQSLRWDGYSPYINCEKCGGCFVD